MPALFLHGGPGSGCNSSQHGLFDPTKHFAIFIDQRGAGKSRPHGERRANTTAHLIEDIEQVRAHLGIERWLLVGGSWGATLALAYAIDHPERVTGIVLRATFLGTPSELTWAFDTGLGAFYPELHKELHRQAPDGLSSLWPRILDPDPEVHVPAARAFGTAERAMSQLIPPKPEPDGPLGATPFMEAHYFLNNCFLEPDALMKNASVLADIPGIVVQARFDLLCPPVTANRLVDAWPASRLVLVEAAGHTLGHPAVFEAVRDGILELTTEA